MTKHFNVSAVVCLNKADLYAAEANSILDQCKEAGVEVIGQIPFCQQVTEAVVAGRPAVEGSGPGASALRQLAEEVWHRLLA